MTDNTPVISENLRSELRKITTVLLRAQAALQDAQTWETSSHVSDPSGASPVVTLPLTGQMPERLVEIDRAAMRAFNALGWDARLNTPDYALSHVFTLELDRQMRAAVVNDGLREFLNNPEVADVTSNAVTSRMHGSVTEIVDATLASLRDSAKHW